VLFPVFCFRDLFNTPSLSPPACPPAPCASSTPGLPHHHLPSGCKGLTMDQQLPRKQCKAVTSSPPGTAVPAMPPCQDPAPCPNRVPSEAGGQLGIALLVGGISLAVPMAQHAPVLTQKQTKSPDSTGLCVSPIGNRAGAPPCPAATSADTAGALCTSVQGGSCFGRKPQ